MEDKGPSAKRAKHDDTSSGKASKESQPLPSEEAGNENVKRKIPKMKEAPREEAKMESKLKVTDLSKPILIQMMQLLPLSDLCAMAEVCVYFKDLALTIFDAKHRNIGFATLANTANGKYSLHKVRQ